MKHFDTKSEEQNKQNLDQRATPNQPKAVGWQFFLVHICGNFNIGK